MTRVNLDVNTWHNDDAEEGDGPWRYRGSTSGTINSVRVVPEGDNYGWGYTGAETDLEPPFFVVYAEYYTGDTFGSDYEATVVGVVKTEEEAMDLTREAEQFQGFGSLSNEFYVPWNGYFESLISVRYERVA